MEFVAKDQPDAGVCQLASYGACCCTCSSHIEDFHHCTTVVDRGGKCVCSIRKGWICMAGESNRAYSNWSEHGICEMHTDKEIQR